MQIKTKQTKTHENKQVQKVAALEVFGSLGQRSYHGGGFFIRSMRSGSPRFANCSDFFLYHLKDFMLVVNINFTDNCAIAGQSFIATQV